MFFETPNFVGWRENSVARVAGRLGLRLDEALDLKDELTAFAWETEEKMPMRDPAVYMTYCKWHLSKWLRTRSRRPQFTESLDVPQWDDDDESEPNQLRLTARENVHAEVDASLIVDAIVNRLRSNGGHGGKVLWTLPLIRFGADRADMKKTLGVSHATVSCHLNRCRKAAEDLRIWSWRAKSNPRPKGHNVPSDRGAVNQTGAGSHLAMTVLCVLILCGSALAQRPPGDVNGDGLVTGGDSLLINQVQVGLRPFIITECDPDDRPTNSVVCAVLIRGIGLQSIWTYSAWLATNGIEPALVLSNVTWQNSTTLKAFVPPTDTNIWTGNIIVATATHTGLSFATFTCDP